MIIKLMGTGLLRHFKGASDMYITIARNSFVMQALELFEKGEATHLFMLDDDVTPPDGFLQKLLSHNAPIVSGVYYTRNNCPCVYNFTEKNEMEWVWKLPETGIVKVDGAGAGCLLIEIAFLKRMQTTFNDPFFFDNHHFLEGGVEKYQGEDVHFFRRCKQLHTPCLIDCEVDCNHATDGIVNRQIANLYCNEQKE